MSIADKLTLIADNTPAVAEAVNAARVRLEGAAVRADGVAEFPLKVQMQGKNMLSAFSKFPNKIAYTAMPIHMRKGQKYVFSFKGEYTTWRLMFRGTQMDGSDFPIGGAVGTMDAFISCIQRTSTESDATYGTRIQMQSNATGNSIVLTCTNDFILTAMQLWVTGTEVTPFYECQLELGEVATEYTPYTEDFTGVGVNVYGKNLLPVITKYINFKNIEYFPVPLHMKAGQKYTFSFQGEYTAWRLMFFGTQMDGSPFPYDISLGPNSGQNASMYLSCYGGVYTIGGPNNLRLQVGANLTGNSEVLTCEQDFYLTAVQFWVTGTEVTPFSACQLELGSDATYYEAYKTPQSATADSTGKVTGLAPVVPTMTVVADSGIAQVSYLPDGELAQKYQEYKTTLVALKEELQ